MAQLFDTHCHFPQARYKKPVDVLLADARVAGVSLFLDIGTSLKDNKRAIEMAELYPDVYASVGIYPHDDRNYSAEALEQKLEDFLKQSEKIKAIGECGIDSPSPRQGGASDERDTSNYGRTIEQQIELLDMQMRLAIRHNMPIVVHNRGGEDAILILLEKYVSQGLRGVMHCFTQKWEYAQKILEYGFYLAFGGIITYPSGENVLETVQKAPLDRILIETDAPWLVPEPMRSQDRNMPNEPRYIVIIAQKIAQTRGIGYDEIARITYENGKRLFTIGERRDS